MPPFHRASEGEYSPSPRETATRRRPASLVLLTANRFNYPVAFCLPPPLRHLGPETFHTISLINQRGNTLLKTSEAFSQQSRISSPLLLAVQGAAPSPQAPPTAPGLILSMCPFVYHSNLCFNESGERGPENRLGDGGHSCEQRRHEPFKKCKRLPARRGIRESVSVAIR